MEPPLPHLSSNTRTATALHLLALFELLGLHILSQNCNSLNLSTFNSDKKKFYEKMFSILSQKADIVCLQDIRLSNKVDILRNFLTHNQFGSFKLYANSNKDARGVCIFIKKEIDLVVSDIFKDQNENYIFLSIIKNSTKFILGSVYGPTDSSNPTFFKDIFNFLENTNSDYFAFLGDLNTVLDMRPPVSNLDLYQNRSIPNPRHRQIINEAICSGFVIDAFREKNKTMQAFSYHPFSQKSNRSRIDHFISSTCLFSFIDLVNYLPRLSNLFDHSGLSMKFISKTKKSNFLPKISSCLLNVIGLRQLVRIKTLETILEHLLVVPVNTELSIRHARTAFQNLTQTIKHYFCTPDPIIKLFIERNLFEIDMALDLLPDIKSFSSLDFNIDKCLFFQTLINNLTIASNDYQNLFKSCQNSRLTSLYKSLVDESLNGNTLGVFEIEQKIVDINSEKIRAQLSQLKSWEILNKERASKSFCSIFRGANKDISLSVINDQNGTEFPNDKARANFINSFYQNIYKKKEKSLDIETFLGEAILNSDYVKNKKIDDDSKIALDEPLRMSELNHALAKANKSSSPGPDGWNYRILEFFWDFVNYFLLESFNLMVKNQSLSHNLSLTNIKLIPKKGSLSDISNWRPISLLSCLYKVVSSAITNRLKSVIDKICSINQKGFSSTKTLHMSLLNILNYISMSNTTNLDSCLIQIDFKKAFDFINHDYILEALKFFNFGDNFIALIRTLLTGRRGGILIDKLISETFLFESGSGQGDPPSPLLFNLGVEIVLIKTKLDPVLIEPSSPLIPIEHKPERNEAYADDITIFLKFCMQNIDRIRYIFKEFQKLSALAINENKCVIIPLVDNLDVIEYIRNSTSFLISYNFRLLGFEIDRKLEKLDVNFDNIIQKLKNIIKFWNKFNLTIFGRITVFNCYLLSQIGFIGTILDPSPAQFQELYKILNYFIIKNEKISTVKLFSKPESGGLGVIDIKNYITGLRVNIFKRSLTCQDHWSKSIQSSRLIESNPYIMNAENPTLSLFPFSKLIVTSFLKWSGAFANYKNNLLEYPIFFNQWAFSQNGKALTVSFSNIKDDKIISVCPRQLLNLDTQPTSILKKNEMEICIGRTLNFAEFFSLQNIAFSIIKKINISFDVPEKIDSFLDSKAKGSKRYRKYFETREYNLGNTRRLDLFPEVGINNFQLSMYNQTWNFSFLLNKYKHTFFNFLSNTLILNAQAAKFNPEADPRCSFCLRTPYLPAAKETAYHIFVSCPSIEFWKTTLFDCLLYTGTFPDPSIIFLGCPPASKEIMLFNNLIILLFVNIVYYNRSNYRMSLSTDISHVLKEEAELMVLISPRLRGTVSRLKRKFTDNEFIWSIDPG